LQKGEIAKDVLLDLVRLGFGIDPLQIHDDLLDGVLAVAALDNFETWTVQAQGALRHEQRSRLLGFFIQSGSRERGAKAVEFRGVIHILSRIPVAGWKAPGEGGHPGLT